MKAMASAAKTISEIFAGKVAYDAAAFKAAAETIRRRSGSAMVDAFPAVTLGEPSAAKTEIEQSREEFAAVARHLESLAAAPSDAADHAPDAHYASHENGTRNVHGQQPASPIFSKVGSASGRQIWESAFTTKTNPILSYCVGCEALARE